MRTVPIAVFKAKLSKFLDQVRSGIEYVVTDHGRPIAKVIPMEPSSQDPLLDELTRSGQVQPAKSKISGRFWDSSRVTDRKDLVLGYLLEEREKGR